jgi:hypothetical protein
MAGQVPSSRLCANARPTTANPANSTAELPENGLLRTAASGLTGQTNAPATKLKAIAISA